ncbi:hypothetical protein ACIBQX_11800 [Nonomuraea sp. NPDC049714]
MTAAERLGAALMTAGLSYRLSALYELDRAADEAVSTIPTQRGAHHAR